MALLATVTERTIQDLRSVSTVDEAAQVEARVGALCGLMQQTATRLCPAAAAAATDAALALLSGLQAARLRLAASPPAAAVVERSSQQLLHALQQGLAPGTPSLEPSAAAAAGPQPATDSGSRQSELSSLVHSLGFSNHDWQAAQAELSQRTKVALAVPPQHGSANTSAAAAAATAAASPGRPSELALSAPLDSVLRTAVSCPAWQPGSGEASLLHGAVADLLWVLCQYPSPAELPPARHPQLSAEGWAAYWVLEPRALQQALAEVLQAATQQQAARTKQHAAVSSDGGGSGWLADPQQLLDSRPHWAATAAAAARHPALHLLARRTLHNWLAGSGNPAAWRLLLHLMQAARSSEGVAQLLRRGQLPVALQVLYPRGLAAAASLLHTQQPTDTRLGEAVALLQRFLGDASEAADAAAQPAGTGSKAAAATAAAEGCLPSADVAAAAAVAAKRRQQVWQLQLDAPGWLLFCLHQLPLEQLLQLAGQSGSGASGAAGPTTPPAEAAEQPPSRLPGSQDMPPSQEALPLSAGAAASPAAARYAALALWPGQPLFQRVLEEALQLQLGDVDLAAVRPWLEALRGWRPLLAAAEAAAATGGVAAAGRNAAMGDASA